MKLLVLDKRNLLITFLLMVFLIGLVTFNFNEVKTVFSAAKRDLPIYCVDRQDKTIAISFDAAWGNEDTGKLIEILEKYKVKTTFFVVGSWVDKYPESVKQLYEAGHEIMNHSNSHPHMTRLSTEKMKEELKKCDDKIEAITGKKPFLFRPPYGDYNNAVVGACREMGHFTIQWDVEADKAM